MTFDFRIFSIMLAFLAFALAPAAVAQNRLGNTELNVPATLVAESQQVRPGQSVTLAFVMEPKPTWHGYWENPGDAGIGMSFDWKLPAGVTAGKPQFPVPDTLLISGIMNYVYKGDYAILVTLDLADNVRPGPLPVSVKSEWLSCTDEICVPEQDELSITLQVVGKDAPVSLDKRFNDFRAAMARPLGSEATFAVSDDRFRLSVPLPASVEIDDPYFFIKQDGVVDYGAPQKFSRDGDRLILETGARGDELDSITGILKIGDHIGFLLTATKGEVAMTGLPLANDGAKQQGSASILFLALGGALLGGLLLNLMPCVFPILSLKAMSLAKAGGSEAIVRRDALAYTAGVVLVATALGAILLGLRASGAAVGWAFQLQDPRIIFVLLALVTAIGLNLAGLFELPNLNFGNKLTRKDGAAGSFWTGALAAFVATPCTGPFMAAALGATIVLPPIAALVIFAGLGVGLALPFLLIAFVPAIRSRLPKPGPWLDGFRKAMAIPMFLTAIGLIWLLGRQIGTDALGLSLIFLLTVALILWWFGGGQIKGLSRGALTSAAMVAAIVGGILMLPGEEVMNSQKLANNSAATLPSEIFSETRLSELRASGQPVFAYFTADWCLTCKANEAAAIQRTETADAFKAARVAVLMGDWTRPDPDISRFLEQHGRAGVPLYLYYAPGQEPVILPQILTVATLTNLVNGPVQSAMIAKTQ
ncbi:MAG: thiol:disulfide interchange protein [Sphingomonadales bacterium]|nr:thiol:disulfide interchange protein [Sphingomonadales bacterium]PIX67008.1 MAG: thiol:disulfide interchange protein [Sphingomonadales bacterium CG_4_10_14_3_um_filter_58_15]NCO49465.1 thiol:disulfide interchange protein [Sphingomonadales bacterium]NCP01310.1 thiol:disulfide interchange protein [Sphingomonadales bacterium]NCP26634.1 thiol:disulfide interchange protein [Sphingomonadales bacterium]